MKHKDMMFTINQLASSNILGEAEVMALKEAEFILTNLSNRFEMVGKDAHNLLHMVVEQLEAPRQDACMVEQFKALQHFANEVPTLIDAALECEIHDSERIRNLYRTLDLSGVDQVAHAHAGKNVFLVSGRCFGDDDDCVDIICASTDEEALGKFLVEDLDLTEEQIEFHNTDHNDPVYFIITNQKIGIVDYRGRIELI